MLILDKYDYDHFKNLTPDFFYIRYAFSNIIPPGFGNDHEYYSALLCVHLGVTEEQLYSMTVAERLTYIYLFGS